MAVAIFIPGTVAIYFAGLVAGGGSLALPFAIVFGSSSCTLFILLDFAVESRFPLSISFGRSEMTWRTRNGRTYTCPYERVVRVLPSRFDGDWSDHTCLRYFVLIAARTPGIRWNISLTPENNDRLEKSLKNVS